MNFYDGCEETLFLPKSKIVSFLKRKMGLPLATTIGKRIESSWGHTRRVEGKYVFCILSFSQCILFVVAHLVYSTSNLHWKKNQITGGPYVPDTHWYHCILEVDRWPCPTLLEGLSNRHHSCCWSRIVYHCPPCSAYLSKNLMDL